MTTSGSHRESSLSLDQERFHRCRNKHCRSKLAQPVELRHDAFCSRNCFVRSYRHHCLVCDKETREAKSADARNPTRNFCSQSCKNAFRRNPSVYAGPGGSKAPPGYSPTVTVQTGPRSAHSTRIFSRDIRSLPPRNLVGGYRHPNAPTLPPKLIKNIRATECPGPSHWREYISPDGVRCLCRKELKVAAVADAPSITAEIEDGVVKDKVNLQC
jgi:hypothetical protein